MGLRPMVDLPFIVLALALLVARVLANDAHGALPAHNLAMLTPHLDRWPDFHRP